MSQLEGPKAVYLLLLFLDSLFYQLSCGCCWWLDNGLCMGYGQSSGCMDPFGKGVLLCFLVGETTQTKLFQMWHSECLQHPRLLQHVRNMTLASFLVVIILIFGYKLFIKIYHFCLLKILHIFKTIFILNCFTNNVYFAFILIVISAWLFKCIYIYMS